MLLGGGYVVLKGSEYVSMKNPNTIWTIKLYLKNVLVISGIVR